MTAQRLSLVLVYALALRPGWDRVLNAYTFGTPESALYLGRK